LNLVKERRQQSSAGEGGGRGSNGKGDGSLDHFGWGVKLVARVGGGKAGCSYEKDVAAIPLGDRRRKERGLRLLEAKGV